MKDASFSLRPFLESDTVALQALGEAEDMGTLRVFEHTEVAIDKNAAVVAFLRISIHDNTHYVNPVVVTPLWRGKGIGRALMDSARKRYGELRFVARSTSIPFYTTLGCTSIPWNMIASEIAADCTDCPLAEKCNPQPMQYLS